ncbi:Protein DETOXIFICATION 37, partial [Linum perenne]
KLFPGVAIGARWQSLVAYINVGYYYIVGLPTRILLGFTFGFGVEGIWSGMIMRIILQTIILVVKSIIPDWDSEVSSKHCIFFFCFPSSRHCFWCINMLSTTGTFQHL